MLYRLTRPMRRKGSQFRQFNRRIPQEVASKLVGKTLSIPFGGHIATVSIGPRTKAIRFSLRSNDPSEVKIRQAEAEAYLEAIFRAARAGGEIDLTHRQAVSLSKAFYDAWAIDVDRLHSLGVEFDENRNPIIIRPSLDEIALGQQSTAQHFRNLRETDNTLALGERIGPLLDRVLMNHGITAVSTNSREVLLKECARAIEQGMTYSARKALEADFTGDPNASRFPAWEEPATRPSSADARQATVSLKGLVDRWWAEAERLGKSQSTHETYERAFKTLAEFLQHDDATRVTTRDIIAFKDWRLNQSSPTTGKPVSARTIKYGDISALSSVFTWAVDNQIVRSNPVAGFKMKAPKAKKLRAKHFTPDEASSILKASLETQPVGKQPYQRWAARAAGILTESAGLP
ncbi:phage integrase N-terminal SAM-like domain-containing protein [Hoeflea sp. YIM 152468]|uniref:site-specific integrase n=1 Tax=Hoeflea sp. YIM 152468 TaxID=3031759 RepID=UPI0023DBEAFD|nr:phage integrase N-terminal SAM-like domain-containing protein [Hoeflea sp. YIM 152468]MDF1609837.1 phage integrase N-terminal SAM-like domain-containing protein [Hoeflea sp. YIM 152468]